MVLDAWALLAWLGNEVGAPMVDDALRRAQADGVRHLISIVNAGEVYYRLAAGRQRQDAEDFLIDLRRHRLPIRVMPATNRRVWDAARLKARFPIAYADAFAASLSRESGLHLLTGDPDFLALAKAGECQVQWIHR